MDFRKLWLFDAVILFLAIFSIFFFKSTAYSLAMAAALILYLWSTFRHPHYIFRRLVASLLMAMLGARLAAHLILENVSTGIAFFDQLILLLGKLFSEPLYKSPEWCFLMALLIIAAIVEMIIYRPVRETNGANTQDADQFRVSFTPEWTYVFVKNSQDNIMINYQMRLRVGAMQNRTVAPSIERIQTGWGLFNFVGGELLNVSLSDDSQTFSVEGVPIQFTSGIDKIIRFDFGLRRSLKVYLLKGLLKIFGSHLQVNLFVNFDKVYSVKNTPQPL